MPTNILTTTSISFGCNPDYFHMVETKSKRSSKRATDPNEASAPFQEPEQHARSGTQSIERVVGMLRVIASRGRRGMRIADVVSVSGLPMSTCFRMLQRLELEGLVYRDPLTRKYHLGPLLYELGLLAQPRYRLSEMCDEALQVIADQTQDTVYLSERRGSESICTSRALGDYPIKALTLDVGIRRLMGVGAGGADHPQRAARSRSGSDRRGQRPAVREVRLLRSRLPARSRDRKPCPGLFVPG
jgi:hypothetical protein